MAEFSSKEKFLLSNTLNCVPHILLGEAVLIDLRNETSVAGRIESADGMMNVELVDAVFIDRNGLQYPFDQFMIRQRMIRQIHIPACIDMSDELAAWVENGVHVRKPRRTATDPKKKGKRTFKQKRAEVRHKEILAEIQKQKRHEPNPAETKSS